jgi:hypothetical protein
MVEVRENQMIFVETELKYHSDIMPFISFLFKLIIYKGKIYKKDTLNSSVEWSEAGYPYRQNPCAY